MALVGTFHDIVRIAVIPRAGRNSLHTCSVHSVKGNEAPTSIHLLSPSISAQRYFILTNGHSLAGAHIRFAAGAFVCVRR